MKKGIWLDREFEDTPGFVQFETEDEADGSEAPRSPELVVVPIRPTAKTA